MPNEENKIKEKRNYAFSQHKACEWFPCHKVSNPVDFNCLFCFCPLYALGKECGGNFSYDNKIGIKDCSGCLLPHQRSSYDYIVEKCRILVEKSKED